MAFPKPGAPWMCVNECAGNLQRSLLPPASTVLFSVFTFSDPKSSFRLEVRAVHYSALQATRELRIQSFDFGFDVLIGMPVDDVQRQPTAVLRRPDMTVFQKALWLKRRIDGDFQRRSLSIGKRILVTGASAGIGVETARALAANGAQVVGAARDLVKAGAATAQAREDVAANGGSFELVALDLASLRSVHACAAELLARRGPFDVVIANAGAMATPFGHTVDAFKTQFGANGNGGTPDASARRQDMNDGCDAEGPSLTTPA